MRTATGRGGSEAGHPVFDSMTDRLVEFVGLLRDHGINAGPSETIDAAEAMVALGLADRNRLRSGMAACLLRRNGQRAVFDQLFDLYFLTAEQPQPAAPSTPEPSMHCGINSFPHWPRMIRRQSPNSLGRR
ncbi:hypothetical protein [Nocardia gipuzkoensis]|uniref:hypothetical protein n=1 Tax=Nocardia gipuzkoensis TaxID=2749991 RepID=UPI003EE32352